MWLPFGNSTRTRGASSTARFLATRTDLGTNKRASISRNAKATGVAGGAAGAATGRAAGTSSAGSTSTLNIVTWSFPTPLQMRHDSCLNERTRPVGASIIMVETRLREHLNRAVQ